MPNVVLTYGLPTIKNNDKIEVFIGALNKVSRLGKCKCFEYD